MPDDANREASSDAGRATSEFSEPRAEGRDVVFEASRGQGTWTFRVTEDALVLANMGQLEGGDPMATFHKCRQWLHDVAERYVTEGFPTDAPIVMDAATLTTASDR